MVSRRGAGVLFILALVLVMFVGVLYLFGLITIPRAGVLRFYYRIRLVGLLWAALLVLIAASRQFDFP